MKPLESQFSLVVLLAFCFQAACGSAVGAETVRSPLKLSKTPSAMKSPRVIEAAPQSVEKQSESAAEALKANANNETALTLLRKNLKSPVAYDRAAAVVAARAAGRNARELVPLLIGALKDESTNVRGESATTLGAIGPDAKAAIPALKEAATSAHPPEQGAGCCMVQRDLWVHAAAERALKLIGGK